MYTIEKDKGGYTFIRNKNVVKITALTVIQFINRYIFDKYINIIKINSV
ncbi:MAG: hypothetical protein OXH57_10720 [Ekhidna sp.]|nr:hypothetical protein [Ekhidna sp.]